MSLPASDRPPSASPTGSEAFWREYAPGESLPHPERIGSYEIRKVLGEGSFGVVYEAEQTSPRRTVALKILRPGLATVKALRRFELEGEILGRLQHPGIAQIFEAGQAEFGYGPQPFLAMELVDGLPLLHYAAEQQLSVTAKVELLESLCEAVQHAHQKGVIHRDLTPANVIVDRSGRPRIVDFGVARLVEAGPEQGSLRTQVGQFVGTLPYMSPEQAAGLPDKIDTRTDVYALGVLAYELLTGQRPLATDGMPITEVVRAIAEEQPPLAGSLNPALRGELETIVAKALEKEKHRRYQSAGGLGADLGRFLSGQPIAARPASNYYLMSRFVRRNRGLVAGLTAAFVFLIVGVLGTTLGMLRAQHAEAGLRLEVDEARRGRELTHGALRELSVRVGVSSIQRPLLEELRRELERREREKPGDLNVGTDLAQTLEDLGKLEKQEGRPEEALALQKRALEIRVELGRAFPDDLEIQKGLSISYVMLGELSRDRGDTKGNKHWFTRALNLDRELAEAYPTDPRLQDNLSWSCERMGALAGRHGDSGARENFYNKRHALAVKQMGIDPDRQKALFNLSSSHGCMFGLALSKEDWRAALEHARQHRSLAEALTIIDPQNKLYLRSLASSFRALAMAHVGLGQKRDSFDMFREYTKRAAPLALGRPRDEGLLNSISIASTTLAELAVELNDLGAAHEACRALLGLGEELERLHPELTVPKRLQAIAHYKGAELHSASTDEGREHARSACDLYRRLCTAPDASRADLVAFAKLFAAAEFEISNPGRAVELLQPAEDSADAGGAIHMALARAHLELGEVGRALEYLALAEAGLGYGNEALEGLRSRCEAARGSIPNEIAPEQRPRVFEGEDR